MLAWSHSDHVFGKQAWLAALDGTSLGREIHQEITEGTRPPFPLTPATVLAGNEVVPPAGSSNRRERRQARRARRRRQRHLARLVAGAGLRLPRVRRQLRASGSAVLNLDPLADALRHGSPEGVRPVDPALVRRPGLQLRLAVTALRAGVLRYVTEDGTIVESDARTPAPGAAAGPVDLIDGAVASASVPMVFPPHPMADDDYVDGGVIEIVPVRAAAALGATRIIAVVAVPLRMARDERDYAAAPLGYIGLRVHGHDRRGRAADLEPQRGAAVGHDPHHDRPRRRRGGPVRGRARAPAHQQGLRLAARRRRPGRERRRHPGRHGRRHPRHRRGPARSLAPGGVAVGDAQRVDGTDAGTMALVREQKERVRALVDQRKQLGFPVPEGCEAWWLDYEAHTAEAPPGLPPAPAASVREG